MTDPVKEKIQSLCPDVVGELECDCGHLVYLGGSQQSRIPITLAVVLRAISEHKSNSGEEGIFVGIMEGGAFIQQNAETSEVTYDGSQWNLSKDNYDDQDEATKVFIGSLILN